MVDYYVVTGQRGYMSYDDVKGEPCFTPHVEDAAMFSTASDAYRVARAHGCGVSAVRDGVNPVATLLTVAEIRSHIVDEQVVR